MVVTINVLFCSESTTFSTGALWYFLVTLSPLAVFHTPIYNENTNGSNTNENMRFSVHPLDITIVN